ncbi:MAG: UDP-N-acetylmuramoyl-L-alanine--D-glutamate ligase [Alphaproteobacteria bacterium]|nr:UDP-N-acetylmuramoyl-L-alanine--D-glutamate ligase [Alphaproteobacteria bacterium]
MPPSFDSSDVPIYAVYGLGVTGLAVMAFFKERGIDACCWDDHPDARMKASTAGYMLWDFGHRGIPQSITMLLMSPGIPWNGQDTDHAAYGLAQQAREQRVPLACDIDWLLAKSTAFTPALIAANAAKFAVSGTNGKTSVVSWLEAIIRLQGFEARALGNNGVVSLASHHDQDCLIFELSSYQLDLMHTAAFDRVMLLNISPDHLERYGSIESYRDSKARILDVLKPNGLGAVISIDDPYCAGIAERAEEQGIPILKLSVQKAIEGGVYLLNGQLVDHRDEVPLVILDATQDVLLNSVQHMRNLTAVYALLCRYPLKNFSALAQKAVRTIAFDHRQNPVGWREKVLFVDDSKATNPIAAADALRQFRRIHWIAGGQTKAGGFDDLRDCFDDLEAVYLIGAAEEELAAYLATRRLPDSVEVHRCSTLDQAMDRVTENLRSGADTPKTVLFAPGCASFDQFANFTVRGNAFIAKAAKCGAHLVAGAPDNAVLSLLRELRRGAQGLKRSGKQPQPPVQLLREASRTTSATQEMTTAGGVLAYFERWIVQVDKVSILAILLIFGFGLIVQSLAVARVNDIVFAKQLIVGLGGLAGMVALSMMSRRALMFIVLLTFLGTFVLMALVPLIGIEIKGAKRWILLPGEDFTLQPVEIFKVAIVSVLAIIQGYACSMGVLKRTRWSISGFFIVLAFALTLIQPDFGQFLLMFAALAVITVLAVELTPLMAVALFSALLPIIFTGVYFYFGHISVRIDDFFNKNYDPTDQVVLAVITAQKAPWFGGVAEGVLRPWYWLSDVESDFVFVLMMQEFGIVVAVFPAVLMLLVLFRAVHRLWAVEDIALRFWLWGLVVLLSGQLFINLATGTGFLPPTGMTLPLISHGGSSLIGVFFSLGLLLFLSRDDIRRC